jgi:endonuclease/exonuclease/phosphatase family metal-dependent hydrolase
MLKRLWIYLVVSVIALGSVQAETLTLATYNVENYLATDRMADGVYRQSYPKPESEKRALRKVIAQLNADVLALQEMGPRPYLEELQRDLASEGVQYPYAELMEGADLDRHIAVLSKRPFTTVRQHKDISFSYFGGSEVVKRGMLEVRFMTSAGELTLFAVHLKSRFTDRADDPNSSLKRLSEARAVRDRILQQTMAQSDGSRFVLAGDCNDLPESEPLSALRQKDGATVAVRLSPADRSGAVWTHFYRKEKTYSTVDHVLVSPWLSSAVISSVIWDEPDVAKASDHRPVVIKLRLAPKEK